MSLEQGDVRGMGASLIFVDPGHFASYFLRGSGVRVNGLLLSEK